MTKTEVLFLFRIILVAMNTEPLDNRHFHIGQLVLFGLSDTREVSSPLWSIQFRPVPLTEGRYLLFPSLHSWLEKRTLI